MFSTVSGHVETVVLLRRVNLAPKDYVEIGIDAEDYYRIKDVEKEEKWRTAVVIAEEDIYRAPWSSKQTAQSGN